MKLTACTGPAQNVPPGSPGLGFGIADAMRQGTQDLHRRAEASGFVAAMLSGRVSRDGYALFLRNLLPAYRALENGLESHRRQPELGALWRPELSRVFSLESDLEAIAGMEWAGRVPLLRQGESYARAIAVAADGDGSRLIAHAYTRFLGDLAGGQILKRCLSRALGLPASALSFYDFPGIGNLPAYSRAYRAALDAAGASLADHAPVVAEARAAFQLNIDLSEAVGAFAGPGPTATTELAHG